MRRIFLLRSILRLFKFALFAATAHHMLELMTPKVVFCTKKPVELIFKAMEDQNYHPIVVVYGEPYPGTIPFSNVLSGYNEAQVANFRYLELDDIKKTVCVIHSSGTTGMPKGVEISNYAVLMIMQDNTISLNDMIVLWFSSLYWISGIIMNIKSIAQGASMIIYPHFDEEMTCRLIEKYNVSGCVENHFSN